MKKLSNILIIILLATSVSAQVGIGTTNPDTSSSVLDIQSTSKGVLIPRVTTAQKNVISGAEGLLIFDSNTKSFWFYNNGWIELASSDSTTSNEIADADNDTKIEVEKNTDEDLIRISTANASGDASIKRITIDNEGVSKFGSPDSNYTKITEDGSLSYVGEATRWDDYRIPVNGLKIKGTVDEPKWDDFIGNTGILWFEDGKSQDVLFTVQLPHSWKEGSDIKPHVHWSTGRGADDAPGTDRVEWGLEYYWANVGDVFPSNTPIIYGDLVPTSATGNLALREHTITPLGTISGTGYDLSSMLVCRLFRVNKSGDYSGDAGLLEIDFHFEIDSNGSNEDFEKH